MNDEVSKRRLIENQVVFRRDNESVEQNFKALKELAKEADQEYLIPDDDTALYFYCECSDEDCRKRIKLAPSSYEQIHKNRSRFIILSGHEAASVEKIVQKRPDFWVVEKFVQPPEVVANLQPTSLHNA